MWKPQYLEYPHIPSSLDFSNTFHLRVAPWQVHWQRNYPNPLNKEEMEQGQVIKVTVFSMWNEDLCLGKLGKAGPVDIEIIGDLCPMWCEKPVLSYVFFCVI